MPPAQQPANWAPHQGATAAVCPRRYFVIIMGAIAPIFSVINSYGAGLTDWNVRGLPCSRAAWQVLRAVVLGRRCSRVQRCALTLPQP